MRLGRAWGSRLHLALTLGVFEVGLSWAVGFGKPDAFRRAFKGFAAEKVAEIALARSHQVDRKRAPRPIADLPGSTPQSAQFARQLNGQRYRFVGLTSVYAFMQNTGVVNDHVHGCFRTSDYRGSRGDSPPWRAQGGVGDGGMQYGRHVP
ncbi:DNA-3-methyladenine glycosylase I [Streptomyces sp. NPDC096040]|uniref:DNA-3-methyladenine glycosylase I n=1 Tax=Streptomyces sp. NPDC096040 TaxID=3155541 RepID=UPI003327589D